MGTAGLISADIEFCQVAAPLAHEAAWEVESLLVSVFEYGNYSFRAALTGEYSEVLDCVFFLAKHKGKTIGVAGCLYGKANPEISIVGPVAVAPAYRGNGIGKRVVTRAIVFLQRQGCRAIYLGVSPGNSAMDFYKSVGFDRYKGVVMRLVLCDEEKFETEYYGKSTCTKVRRANWGDFPSIMALVSLPCSMYTIDFPRSIFSAKYVEPTKFLSVFPEMMAAFAEDGGFANVLVSGQKGNVVGLAHLARLPTKARQHVASLDFYVHDNFIVDAEQLLRTTIKECDCLRVDRISCYCLACDALKQNILQKLGVTQIAALPGNVCINGSCEDVLLCQLSRCCDAPR